MLGWATAKSTTCQITSVNGAWISWISSIFLEHMTCTERFKVDFELCLRLPRAHSMFVFGVYISYIIQVVYIYVYKYYLQLMIQEQSSIHIWIASSRHVLHPPPIKQTHPLQRTSLCVHNPRWVAHFFFSPTRLISCIKSMCEVPTAVSRSFHQSMGTIRSRYMIHHVCLQCTADVYPKRFRWSVRLVGQEIFNL